MSEEKEYNLDNLRRNISTIIEFQKQATEREQKEFIKKPTIKEKLINNWEKFDEKEKVESPQELYNEKGEAVGITQYNQETGKIVFYNYQDINYDGKMELPNLKPKNQGIIEEKERREELEKLQQSELQKLEQDQEKQNQKKREYTSKQSNEKQIEL